MKLSFCVKKREAKAYFYGHVLIDSRRLLAFIFYPTPHQISHLPLKLVYTTTRYLAIVKLYYHELCASKFYVYFPRLVLICYCHYMKGRIFSYLYPQDPAENDYLIGTG